MKTTIIFLILNCFVISGCATNILSPRGKAIVGGHEKLSKFSRPYLLSKTSLTHRANAELCGAKCRRDFKDDETRDHSMLAACFSYCDALYSNN